MNKYNYIPQRTVFLVFVTAFFFAPGCGSKGLTDFIPNLSNTWQNKADATNTFFFFPAQTNTNMSTFTGNVNPPGGGSQIHIAGSFENENVEFTYTDGPNTGKKYSGKFIKNSNPFRMELKSGTEDLILEQH